MKRTLLSLALVAAGACAFAGSAAASGPAAPGKRVINITCEELGAISVTLPKPERSNGAGQAIGVQAHGLAAAITFFATDVTTGEFLFTNTEPTKRGRTQSGQGTVACQEAALEGEASQFFKELPPGVAPTDIVRIEIEVHVIRKP